MEEFDYIVVGGGPGGCVRASRLSCPMSAISAPDEVVRSEQLRAREFFVDVEHAVAGTVTLPARPCHFAKTPFTPEHAAPLLGEHSRAVFEELLASELDDIHPVVYARRATPGDAYAQTRRYP